MAERTNGILGCTRSAASRLREEMVLPLYSALLRPLLEGWLQLCTPQCKKYIELLDRVHPRVTKEMKGLEHLSCEGWERLGLLSLDRKGFVGSSSMCMNI